MNILSPTTKISMGLTAIIISVLLTGSFIGLVPDTARIQWESRKNVVQAITTQCMSAAKYNDPAIFEKTVNEVLSLNPSVLSLGIRSENGKYIAQTGGHQTSWVPPEGDKSTLTHWQVPILRGEQPWATMEICFPPEDSTSLLGYPVSSLFIMLAFCACFCFLMFFVYMKKVLRELDPSKVMPGRVVYALNALMEGVILVDLDERIVLANKAFAEKVGGSVESLLGLKASELPWRSPETKQVPTEYPWIRAMSHGAQSAIGLNLKTENDTERLFVVSSVPIRGEKDKIRGIMATFDDITEIEKKNIQLSEMLVVLENSRDKIKQQNKELEILATRDSLTGCLNRRAFFEKGEYFWSTASQNNGILSCVMADIDLFKSVNDTHGHSVGDQVIKFFASSLMSSVRDESDVVGRYGGEEFCIVLKDVSMEKAAEIIDRIRIHVMEQSPVSIKDAPGIRVTASFGVSSSALGADSLEELITQADEALYKAKETGRNRVICWEKDDKSENQLA